MEVQSEHIVLLGDSIIDNGRYIPEGAPDVRAQLLAAVTPRGWRVSQLARDGAMMQQVSDFQLYAVPSTVSVFVLSIGGNDGLHALVHLRRAPWTLLTTFFSKFRLEYETLLDNILDTWKHVGLVVCTIYQPQFPGWVLWTVGTVGVQLINRIIRDCARARSLPVLDLWTIFSQREDYANAIEPGVPGGAKLVRNLLQCIDKGDHMRASSRHVLYADSAAVETAHVHFDEDRLSGINSFS